MLGNREDSRPSEKRGAAAVTALHPEKLRAGFAVLRGAELGSQNSPRHWDGHRLRPSN